MIFHCRLNSYCGTSSIYLIWSLYLNNAADLGLLWSILHTTISQTPSCLAKPGCMGYCASSGCWATHPVKPKSSGGIIPTCSTYSMQWKCMEHQTQDKLSENTNQLCSYSDTRTVRSQSLWPRHGTSLFCHNAEIAAVAIFVSRAEVSSSLITYGYGSVSSVP